MSHHEKDKNGVVLNSHSIVSFDNGTVLVSNTGYSGNFEQNFEVCSCCDSLWFVYSPP